MSEPWFRPKTHGYGAYPCHWKGWASIGGYAAAMTVLASTFLAEPMRNGAQLPKEALYVYLALAALLSVGFILFVRSKTEGGWSWQWGAKEPKQ